MFLVQDIIHSFLIYFNCFILHIYLSIYIYIYTGCSKRLCVPDDCTAIIRCSEILYHPIHTHTHTSLSFFVSMRHLPLSSLHVKPFSIQIYNLNQAILYLSFILQQEICVTFFLFHLLSSLYGPLWLPREQHLYGGAVHFRNTFMKGKS